MPKLKKIAKSSKLQLLMRENKTSILLGLLILAIALVLRLYNLSYLPIFGDEAIYIRWAQIMRVEPGLRFVPLSDGKQPLFMWSVIPFSKIFSDPLIAGRLVSVLSGVGTTLGVGILTYVLFKSKRASLIAALIYAISPYAVFFDRMALVDSMLSFFGIWTLIFSVLTVRYFRLDYAMLAGFTLGGAFLTKSPAIFFALLIPFSLLLAPIKKDNFKRVIIKAAPLFFVTYIIGFGLYNILRLGPEFHMLSIRNKDYVYPLTHILQSPFNPLITFIEASVNWFWKLGPSVFLPLASAGLLLNFRKYKSEILLLSTWVFIPWFASAEYAKVFTARYILYILPYLVILAASVFIMSRKGILKVFLFAFVMHATIVNIQILGNVESAPLPRSERSGYLEEWTAGTGIKEISEYIREQAKNLPAGRQVIVGTEGYFGTLPNGLQVYLNDIPEITVIGTGLDFTEVPESLIESKEAGNKTYFVVNSTRFLVNPEDIGLKVIKVYPKAERPDGSRENMMFMEVKDNNFGDS